MTGQKLPTNALEDANLRRRVIEVLNQLTEALPIESGSWTATMRGSGTAGTYEIGTQFCRYTRFGRRVWLDFYIIMAGSVTGGGTGYLQITGSPFVKAANTLPRGSVVVDGIAYTAGGSLAVSFIGSTATSALYIAVSTNGASVAEIQISGINANDALSGSISYETDDP